MTQTTDQERAEFEAAYVAEKLRILDSEGSEDGEKAIRAVMLRRNARGDYDNSLEAHFAWWAWQAARRAQVVHKCSECEDTGVGISHGYDCTSCYGALPAAPQPPACNQSMQPELATKAAPVQMPEPFTTLVRKASWSPNCYEASPLSNAKDYGRQWADERINVYTEHQVRQLLAQHGIK